MQAPFLFARMTWTKDLWPVNIDPMAYDYDELYGTQPDALGVPTKAFVEFFAKRADETLNVLDIGCGQGRDALFIARAGHKVVGVDLSANGVRDMLAVAEKEGLAIEGVVADVSAFVPDQPFDILLIDRTLHMLPKPARLAVLAQLIPAVVPGGWALIADERANIAGFRSIFDDHDAEWHIETDKRGLFFLRRD